MRRHGESGSILVVVLMVMLGLLALGITAMWLTSGNLQVGANMSQRTQALYVAEAGIEKAREILNALPPPTVPSALFAGVGPNCGGGNGDDVPSAGNPNGVGAIMIDTATAPVPAPAAPYPALCGFTYPPTAAASSTWRGTGAPTVVAPAVRPLMPDVMGRYTVWIRNDTAETRQGMWNVDTNGSVVVTSRGVAPDNRTVVVLEVTLGPNMGAPASPGMLLAAPIELCANGRNACDQNNNVNYGAVIGN